MNMATDGKKANVRLLIKFEERVHCGRKQMCEYVGDAEKGTLFVFDRKQLRDEPKSGEVWLCETVRQIGGTEAKKIVTVNLLEQIPSNITLKFHLGIKPKTGEKQWQSRRNCTEVLNDILFIMDKESNTKLGQPEDSWNCTLKKIIGDRIILVESKGLNLSPRALRRRERKIGDTQKVA